RGPGRAAPDGTDRRARGMARRLLGAALYAMSLHLTAISAAAAPYVAGNRVFPSTPTTEDPFVAGEFSLGATTMRHGASGDEPAFRDTEVSSELALRVTDDVSIGLEGTYVFHDPAGQPGSSGFGNLEAFIKYQFYVSDEHELLLSAGVVHEFGGTGAERVGAESVGSTMPAVYFGKGFGDLPEGMKYLRPLAMTGSIGYEFADQRSHTTTEIDPDTGQASLGVEHSPDILVLGVALGYSLRYLQGNVDYIGLPPFIGRLTPVIEFAYETPVTKPYGAEPSGVIAPGFIYSGIGYDVGAEALIPVTDAAGTGVGAIVKLNIFLDKYIPPLLPRPLLQR
ncbi:MAG: hypothetical protein WCF16_02025, partial [Alphaproteobacteria bacterium]